MVRKSSPRGVSAMSTSTRSKPESQSSRATGPETDNKTPSTTSVELEPSRQRQLTWAIGGTIGGILLIMKLGTVGVWAGYVLIALGLFRAYQLVMTFVNPPGTITVTDSKVVLPRGLHRGKPIEVTPKDVTAVYFLRRSVPWKHASPVLVVELGEKAMAYPRD